MEKELKEYIKRMKEDEKSPSTISQYIRDIRAFAKFTDGNALSKEMTVKYKAYLAERYKAGSVNTKIAAVNGFLSFLGRDELRIKRLRVQKIAFVCEEKELTHAEYRKLLTAANADSEKLALLIQTICATGIRVSELKYINAEAVKSGKAVIRMKGKVRVVLICGKLKKNLEGYMKKHRIKEGSIFVTRNGKPMDRSNIWKKLKSLCEKAGVMRSKVFPHNLRHLFARCFYSVSKDIAKLADVLGHSSINTTRIYVMSSDNEHMKILERLDLTM